MPRNVIDQESTSVFLSIGVARRRSNVASRRCADEQSTRARLKHAYYSTIGDEPMHDFRSKEQRHLLQHSI